MKNKITGILLVDKKTNKIVKIPKIAIGLVLALIIIMALWIPNNKLKSTQSFLDSSFYLP